tara:strand:+ start:2305 stop:2508 length:204 start_codon:yes stop_codon:yes gene_type:complete
MLEFLWNVPIVLFDFALNVLFWGTLGGFFVYIVYLGTQKYIQLTKNNNDDDDDDYDPYEHNYENTSN